MESSIHALRTTVVTFALLALSAAGPAVAEGDGGVDTETTTSRSPLRTDFLDAAYLPGPQRVAVTGLHGLVGLLDVGDKEAKLEVAKKHPAEDFTALARISDSEVMLGSSTGRVYRFDGTTITEVAALSEYNEPVLDIAASEHGIWVVGARGLIAYSSDGENFEQVEVHDATMPRTEFPGAQPADWYFGVSNLDTETIEFVGYVDGEPAVADKDYIMFPDEGFVQLQRQLDMDPPPTIAFKFDPGPPFRAGDVSWNVVLVEGTSVTIAGEFGMILQSNDNGKTWIRRDVEIVPREPEPAYWMAGVRKGDEMWLTGAAGVIQSSSDAGATWTDVTKPGREGIFGITLLAGDKPLIAGAVGLIGTLENGKWKLADRTRLKLLSWMKTPVAMPDGTYIVTGGRATAIRYANGRFERVPVDF